MIALNAQSHAKIFKSTNKIYHYDKTVHNDFPDSHIYNITIVATVLGLTSI